MPIILSGAASVGTAVVAYSKDSSCLSDCVFSISEKPPIMVPLHVLVAEFSCIIFIQPYFIDTRGRCFRTLLAGTIFLFVESGTPPETFKWGTPRWKLNEGDWSLFSERLVAAFTSFDNFVINDATNLLTNNILAAPIVSIPIT